MNSDNPDSLPGHSIELDEYGSAHVTYKGPETAADQALFQISVKGNRYLIGSAAQAVFIDVVPAYRERRDRMGNLLSTPTTIEGDTIYVHTLNGTARGKLRLTFNEIPLDKYTKVTLRISDGSVSSDGVN